MQKSGLLLFWFFLISVFTSGQGLRKPGAPLNHPSLNYWSPFISFDGQRLLFLSDLNDEQTPLLFYTSKTGGDWKEPSPLSKTINAGFNFRDGFSISADSKTIYVSIQRAGGLGGYDLIGCEIKPDGIGMGVNPGAPINSKEHDASLVFTPDGNTLYVMRCQTMNATSCKDCRILTAQKKQNGQWETPVDLPEKINQGNSQFPRIMSDGRTLIFSSDHHLPNQGGMDLYLTRLQGDHWTDPVPMNFLNSAADERIVSATASGRYVMLSQKGKTKNELVEIAFPSDLKPAAVLRINGSVTGVTENPAYISAYEKFSGNKLYGTRTDMQGVFQLFLAEGSAYYLVADPADDHLKFDSRNIDLRTGPINVAEKMSFSLNTVKTGDEFIINGIETDSLNGNLLPGSIQILNRIGRLLQGNPQLNFSMDFSSAAAGDRAYYDAINRLKDSVEIYLRGRNLKNLAGFSVQGKSVQMGNGMPVITIKAE